MVSTDGVNGMWHSDLLPGDFTQDSGGGITAAVAADATRTAQDLNSTQGAGPDIPPSYRPDTGEFRQVALQAAKDLSAALLSGDPQALAAAQLEMLANPPSAALFQPTGPQMMATPPPPSPMSGRDLAMSSFSFGGLVGLPGAAAYSYAQTPEQIQAANTFANASAAMIVAGAGAPSEPVTTGAITGEPGDPVLVASATAVPDLSDDFVPNADQTVTGPRGATYTPASGSLNQGLQVYRAGDPDEPYYVTLNGGLQSSPAPSIIAGETSGSIVSANYAVHAEAVNDVGANLESQILTVTTNVKMTATDQSGLTVTSFPDLVVSEGIPGQSVQVPPGFQLEDGYGNAAFDENGDAVTSFPLNSNGHAIVEINDRIIGDRPRSE
jgi:hypothetical protein